VTNSARSNIQNKGSLIIVEHASGPDRRADQPRPEGIATANGFEPDPTLRRLLRRAHAWRQQLETGHPERITDLAAANAGNASYFTRVLRIAYLAPDIIEAIVEGRQPSELTANKLVRVKNLPIDWPGQREALGFPAA
jgi:hypothetical protein